MKVGSANGNRAWMRVGLIRITPLTEANGVSNALCLIDSGSARVARAERGKRGAAG
jgi:hypothetical protein